MSALIRVLLPVLTAALVSACAVSSVSETASNQLPASAITPQPAAQAPKEAATQSDSANDQDAVRKVALS